MNKTKRSIEIGSVLFLVFFVNIYPLTVEYARISSIKASNTINIQTSSNYEYEWYQIYNGERTDQGYNLVVDSLNNTYITGFQEGGRQLMVLKYNQNGILLWNRSSGRILSEGRDIAVDNLNNIFITGFINYQMVLLEYNSSGDVQMNKTIGGYTYSAGYGIDIDNSGNIFITGSAYYIGGYNNILLLKYNSSGYLELHKTFGNVESQGQDIIVDDLGNIYITGYKQNGLNNLDLYLLKCDPSGNLEWEELWGGSGNDYGEGIILDRVGDIFITGFKENSLDLDLCLLHYNSTGMLQWAITWGGDEDDRGYDIKIDNMDNIYVAGTSGSFKYYNNYQDVLLIKFNKNGNILGFKRWDVGSSIGFGLALDNFNNAYLTGFLWGNAFLDTFLLKYNLEMFPTYNSGPSISGYPFLIFFIGIGIISIVLILINKNKYSLN